MSTNPADVAKTASPPINTTCPKCSGTMVRGYSMDCTHSAVLPTYWIQGLPKAGWLGGMKAPATVKLVPIAGFRCENCGYLELYARKEFKPK